MTNTTPWRFLAAVTSLLWAVPASAQVDQTRAAAYFAEAAALCEREGGRLWGVSLCGPMVFADPTTRTMATSQPAPEAPWPPALGLANTALEWGGSRWTAIAWPMVPADAHLRARLMLHELFHRVQPQLGFVLRDGDNAHLDTLDGRYWLQLEWRALAGALGSAEPERSAAIRDALAFRLARHAAFPGSAENERLLVINEGLAQYTGTVVAKPTAAEAAADAIDQLTRAPRNETFVRTFAYPSGAAYGLLLDAWSPGWTRRVKGDDDVALLLATAARLDPSADAEAAAARYGGADLHVAEVKREIERQARVADLRRRFVEGPVLVLPPAKSASFVTTGMTPIPGAGTIYPSFRTTTEWGTLEAERALVATDRSAVTLPAPPSAEGPSLKGDGWTLTLAPGWALRPGPRPGDFQVVRLP